MLLDKRIQLVYIAVDDYVQPFLHRVVLGNLLDGKRFRHFFFWFRLFVRGLTGGVRLPALIRLLEGGWSVGKRRSEVQSNSSASRGAIGEGELVQRYTSE